MTRVTLYRALIREVRLHRFGWPTSEERERRLGVFSEWRDAFDAGQRVKTEAGWVKINTRIEEFTVPIRCAHCGDTEDVGWVPWRKKFECDDCRNELDGGALPAPATITGRHGNEPTRRAGRIATEDQGGGPWQQKVLRELEDG